jgi:hypothetical protein
MKGSSRYAMYFIVLLVFVIIMFILAYIMNVNFIKDLLGSWFS